MPSMIVNLCRTAHAPIFRIAFTIDIRAFGHAAGWMQRSRKPSIMVASPQRSFNRCG
jgi:hypothetical protein